MAEIDPSITARAGQAGTNLLGQFSQLASAAVALQHNRLLAQEANSRQRMGELAAAAQRPDGSFDSDTYVKHILADPTTAPFAPQVMNQFAERGLIDANTTARKIENWKARYDTIAGVASAAGQDVPNDGQPADTKGFIGRVSDLMSLKHPDGSVMFTPQEITGYLTHALAGVKTNGDLKGHLQQVAMGSLRGREMLNNLGTVEGLGPNGEPKMFFYNRMAQAMGAGGNASAAAAYMSGAGGVGGPGGGAPATGVAPAPSPHAAAAPSSGLTLGPSAPEQIGLKALPEYIQHVNAGAASAQNLNFQLDKLDEVRKQFKAGPGASTYQDLAKLMASVGVRRDFVDKVANGSYPAGETFNSLTQQVAVSLMKQQLLSRTAEESGAGRLLQSEWTSYIANKPNWEHDPRTLESLLGFMRKQNGLATAKANALQLTLLRMRKGEQVGSMRGQGDITTGFEPYWLNNLYSRGIISQGTAEELGGTR